MNWEEIIPHEEYEIAARYAKALHQAASGQENIYQIDTELKMFLSILKKQENLEKVLNHPVIGLSEKEALLNCIFEGKWASDMSKNFITLLAKEKRLPILKYIIAVYREITFMLEKKIKAYATSYSELSSEAAAALTRHLSKEIGKDIEFDLSIDKSLIGGLVIMIGDRLYDGSVKKRLQLLRKELV